MRRFLRVENHDSHLEYINLDRIERIEIQRPETQAVIYCIGKSEPIVLKGESKCSEAIRSSISSVGISPWRPRT